MPNPRISWWTALLAYALLAYVSPTESKAEIVKETGSLLEFFHGREPNCSYDNWVSHTVEGIASPGFNDYGPVELDRQTNGFGKFQPVDSMQNPQKLLDDWYAIFANIVVGRIEQADTLLQKSECKDAFELVNLEDGAKRYILVREKLNPIYYDNNGTADSADDVRGAFNYGWGLYIFNTTPANPRLVFEIAHPNDDFIAPPITMDAFLLNDARAFFISGVGREVLWAVDSVYHNSKTLCDPSRVAVKSIYQQAHKAIVDSVEKEFIVQVHSYDTRDRDYEMTLLSTLTDTMPNAPVMDRKTKFDILSLTPKYPVLANTIGGFQHTACRIDTFYACHNYGADYYTRLDSIEINPNVTMGLSYWPSPQVIYSHANHKFDDNEEVWLHVEHCELPPMFKVTPTVFYKADGRVPTYRNYANAVQFYRPLYLAIREYFLGKPRTLMVPDEYRTIQQAIIRSYDGDTVLVKPGVYRENINFMGRKVMLSSLFGATTERAYIDSTTIDGGLNRVLTFEKGETSLSKVIGFRLRSGFGDTGGAVSIKSASPTIAYSVLYSNSSRTNGGAVHVTGGKPLFVNCTFSRNSAEGQGGALYATDGAYVTLRNCLMWENSPQEIAINPAATPCTLRVTYSDVGGGDFCQLFNPKDSIYWGVENIDANPLFNSPDQGDFKPLAVSPVVNAGDPADSLDSDSSRADIGALAPLVAETVYEPTIHPTEYLLEPPYPNPFNPVCRFSWSIPTAEYVTLDLYDISGRLVLTIADGYHQAGRYNVTLKALHLSAGSYFVRITAGQFTGVQKVTLVR